MCQRLVDVLSARKSNKTVRRRGRKDSIQSLFQHLEHFYELVVEFGLNEINLQMNQKKKKKVVNYVLI